MPKSFSPIGVHLIGQGLGTSGCFGQRFQGLEELGFEVYDSGLRFRGSASKS